MASHTGGLFCGNFTGLHSFNAMEEAFQDGDFDKFFSNINLSSADTIPYALMRINVNDLREIAADIVQKALYNKSLNNNLIDGLKVVAIDGTHVFVKDLVKMLINMNIRIINNE